MCALPVTWLRSASSMDCVWYSKTEDVDVRNMHAWCVQRSKEHTSKRSMRALQTLTLSNCVTMDCARSAGIFSCSISSSSAGVCEDKEE